MGNNLLPHHLKDLNKSGLLDKAINALGFYSVTAEEVRHFSSVDKVADNRNIYRSTRQ